eukprot:CAMPEP_0175138382 /NCGR_PEP_ID=MMETSP0087-20121206/10318_1 /TAXON_ID=136419 /ORGANISM="Unknown Unknown, Strain D1" /LENGTH=483 /DNA_ID=CAMNT_0016421279 /DNA_START=58 /DNA_END=1509 /DNA_ORIENTATION=+
MKPKPPAAENTARSGRTPRKQLGADRSESAGSMGFGLNGTAISSSYNPPATAAASTKPSIEVKTAWGSRPGSRKSPSKKSPSKKGGSTKTESVKSPRVSQQQAGPKRGEKRQARVIMKANVTINKPSTPRVGPASPRTNATSPSSTQKFEQTGGPMSHFTAADFDKKKPQTQPVDSSFVMNKPFKITTDTWQSHSQMFHGQPNSSPTSAGSKKNEVKQEAMEEDEDDDYDDYYVMTQTEHEAKLFKNGREVTSYLMPAVLTVSDYGVFVVDGNKRLWWDDEVIASNVNVASMASWKGDIWTLSTAGNISKNLTKVGRGKRQWQLLPPATMAAHNNDLFSLNSQGVFYHNTRQQLGKDYGPGASLALGVIEPNEKKWNKFDKNRPPTVVDVWTLTASGGLYKNHRSFGTSKSESSPVNHRGIAVCGTHVYVLNQDGSVTRDGQEIEPSGSYKNPVQICAAKATFLLKEGEVDTAKSAWPLRKAL